MLLAGCRDTGPFRGGTQRPSTGCKPLLLPTQEVGSLASPCLCCSLVLWAWPFVALMGSVDSCTLLTRLLPGTSPTPGGVSCPLVLKTLPLPGCVRASSMGSGGTLEVPSGWWTPTRPVWARADGAHSGSPAHQLVSLSLLLVSTAPGLGEVVPSGPGNTPKALQRRGPVSAPVAWGPQPHHQTPDATRHIPSLS